MTKHGMYFLINKKEDFLRGEAGGIAFGEDGITLAKGCDAGMYRTRTFDGGQRGLQWHRLLMQGSFAQGSVSVTCYASEKKEDIFSPSTKKAVYQNAVDVLLDGVTGRYLGLELTFARQNGESVTVSRIKICFPRHTWLSYLPEIYGEDGQSASFLARYLGIFQSLYEDITHKIERIPQRFSPYTGDPAALRELAGWLGIEYPDFWNGDQLRYLVKHAGRLASIRGTAAYLKELIRLATGKQAYIVEYCQIEPFFDGGDTEERLKRLYASGPYEFTILLDRHDESGTGDLYLVGRIAEMGKPAWLECRITALAPYIFLDRHSYLGINSVLGRYRTLYLDGKCAVPFSVIAGEDEEIEKSEIFSI